VIASRPRGAITVARVQAIEITLNWRWVPILALGTWLLAQNVLPGRFPMWDLGTTWLTSVAIVLAGEVALLLHELGHALMARGRGQEVLRIVFHGFQAETICAEGSPTPAHEVLIALAGPGVNLALAGLLQTARFALATQGPLDVVLLLLLIGNVAMAVMSLIPLGPSDGRRVLNALRRTRRSSYRTGPGPE
jgi:Zn-dependent protease